MFPPIHPFPWANLLALALALTVTQQVVGQAPGQRALPSAAIEEKIDEQAKLIEANTEHQRKTEAAIKEMQVTLAKFAAVRREDDVDDKKPAERGTVRFLQERLIKQRMHELEKWQNLEEDLEAKRIRQVKENFRNVQVWEVTMRNALVKYRPGIHSGDLLNRLFSQIEVSSGLSSASTVSPAVSAGLSKLDERRLKQLTLNIHSVNGLVSVSLDGRLPPAMERWPYLFSDPALRPHVTAFKDTFAWFQQLAPEDRFAAEQELLLKIEDATTALQRKYPPANRRSLRKITLRRVLDAERFLEDLSRNMATLAEEQALAARESFFDTYAQEQRNVAALIQYMTRYGLSFSAAEPGQETFYDILFREAYTLSNQLNAAPNRDSITAPIINLDLDEMVRDPRDPLE